MEQPLNLQVDIDQQKLVVEIVAALSEKGFYTIQPKMLTRKEAADLMGYGVDTFDEVRHKSRFPKPVNSKYSNLAIIEWMRDLNNFQR